MASMPQRCTWIMASVAYLDPAACSRNRSFASSFAPSDNARRSRWAGRRANRSPAVGEDRAGGNRLGQGWPAQPVVSGHVRQSGGNWCVAEVAVDHAATVEIGVAAASIMVGVIAADGRQSCVQRAIEGGAMNLEHPRHLASRWALARYETRMSIVALSRRGAPPARAQMAFKEFR